MKIQLKRSNVLENGLAKEPTSAQMEFGEIAVNYNTADPTLFIKDSANGIVRITGDSSLLPDPLDGTAHQPGTLDERYVSRFSWSNLPELP